MPHRLKAASASLAHLCGLRCTESPPVVRSRHPTEPMGDLASPRVARQRVYQITARNCLQSDPRGMDGWRSELDGKIVEMNVKLEEFLQELVPSREPVPEIRRGVAFTPRVPEGRHERCMYEPLLGGLTKLVEDFDSNVRPYFHNNAHEEIKFPFELCETSQHVTKPDVVASLPGQPFDGKYPDRWRNISVVFEAKSTAEQDPMEYVTHENDEALVQLSKSARNILVAQSRLFVFVIGVYGSVARIFRFDHAGALCSLPFKYMEQNGHILRSFLWRLVHPIDLGCDIVGADPTVALASSEDRVTLLQELESAGMAFENRKETSKAFRWIKVEGEKKYLIYKLIFINPGLISRATTVWEALVLDDSGRPTKRKVVIKDSWRQLARHSEADYYEDIKKFFTGHTDPDAMATVWHGLSEYESGVDLGREECLNDESNAVPAGQLTTSGFYQVYGQHSFFERSHMRLVLKTVGTPLSQFQETREMVQALREAIDGHRKLFEAGVLHRDISEGNVMIARGCDFGGFLQDLDYGFHWKDFLKLHGWKTTPESWAEFVKTETGITDPAANPTVDPAQPRQRPRKPESPPPPPIVNKKGQKEYFVEAIVDERCANKDGVKKRSFLVKWQGYKGREAYSWEPLANVRNCKALEDWFRHRSRKDLFEPAMDAKAGDRERAIGDGVSANHRLGEAEEQRLQCKQRTGTLYFMAIEVLEGESDITHEVRHDLESFYWLLVWIVLRHTAHRHRDGRNACRDVFDGSTDGVCASLKARAVRINRHLVVNGNPPLTALIQDLSKLCARNFGPPNSDDPVIPLTYESVLGAFDTALARTDWPTNDGAMPYITPDNSTQPKYTARPSTVLSSQQHKQARLGLFPLNRPQNDEPQPLPAQASQAQGHRDAASDGVLGRISYLVPWADEEDSAHILRNVPDSPPSPSPAPRSIAPLPRRYAQTAGQLLPSLDEWPPLGGTSRASRDRAGPSHAQSGAPRLSGWVYRGDSSGGSSRSGRKRSRRERGNDDDDDDSRSELSKRNRTDSPEGVPWGRSSSRGSVPPSEYE